MTVVRGPAVRGTAAGHRGVAVVTGGATGIGAATVCRLVDAGHQVVFSYLSSQDQARELAARVQAGGGTCLPVRADVSDPGSIDRLFSRAESAYGSVSILICAAGILADAPLVEMEDAAWQRSLDVNLTAVFTCMRRAATAMIRQRQGRIVVLGSVAAVCGATGQVNYAAAKAGLIGLVRAAAAELAPRGITCNLVLPGPVNTTMIGHLSESRRAALAARIPLRRFGEASEVAGTAVFLAGEAASYITGAVVPVDGGMSMGL
jgi:3-oxoacyl-[acyl-carrier protein] reductase